MKNGRKIELLAPAKNKETAIAAINAGADALYMGYLKFGARNIAGNSLEDIRAVVDYAHIFRVKVYITINTILTDADIKETEKLINDLYLIGVDSIIIQDMGILELELPPINIIASTQCHNNTLEKILFLEKTGFKRVILPREFSLDEIKNISQNTNIELESFVHGALCVSYSGQCYLSYAIGGRSANRGECAQPCRKQYSLKDSDGNIIAKDKYLLSLKDFNLSDYIKELIDAGITSFKIEGRLKDESYIKNVVGYYRNKIDMALYQSNLEKSSQGLINLDFEPDLFKTFNRKYTTYFTTGIRDNICTKSYSKSIGEKIGMVKYLSKDYFVVDNNNLNPGDGICFFDSNNQLIGTNINTVSENKVFPADMSDIERGAEIYRNFDKKFSDLLKISKTSRVIPVSLKIIMNDNNITFQLFDIENNFAEININNDFELAKNQENALENIIKQFSKLGGTEFYLAEKFIKMNKIPFIPVSRLNSIRRELVEELRNQREKNYKFEKRVSKISVVEYPYKNLDYTFNVHNKYAKKFYEKRGVTFISPSLESSVKVEPDTVVMTTKHCLRYEFGLCPKKNAKSSKSKNLILIDGYKKEYNLEFDCKNCIMKVIF